MVFAISLSYLARSQTSSSISAEETEYKKLALFNYSLIIQLVRYILWDVSDAAWQASN